MKQAYLLLLLIFSLSTKAQFSKVEYYNNIDNKVFLYNLNGDHPFDSITAFVNKTFQLTEEKVRAYYTWIVLNISYDTQRLKDLEVMSVFNVNGSNNFSQVADTVFKRKVGVCEGYSNLMIKFCQASGIPCEKVIGYTKMPDGAVVTNIMHVWNVVKVDSAFGVLDATWSNGYIDPNGKFVKKFSDKYFLSKPGNFIKDHFPLDPMWQLLKYPISKNDFKADSIVFNKTKPFNYVDSIKAYLKLPKEEKEYTDFLHYYLSDTSERLFAANLDIYINNAAASELISSGLFYEDYINFHNNVLAKKPSKTNFKKAREMLLNCKRNHKAVIVLLKKTRANTEAYRDTFLKMEEAVIKQEQTVDEQLAYLKKMEKSIGKK